MLGFGKKKKDADTDSPKEPESLESQDSTQDQDDQVKPQASETKKAKRKFPLKMIIIVLVVLAVAASGFTVFKLYFSSDSSEDAKPVYRSVVFEHIDLPEEMLKFCFDHFPELYASMLVFNKEINLIQKEIDRIEAISQKYPEQIKISGKEKKVWEKTKITLEKAFLKIEKPVKETYVLYQVNETAGTAQIAERRTPLSELATTALAATAPMTQTLKSTETIPDGLIKGNIYKLKKKFL